MVSRKSKRLSLLEKAKEREWVYGFDTLRLVDAEDTEILCDYGEELARWANSICQFGVRPKVIFSEGGNERVVEISPLLSTQLEINQQKRLERMDSSLYDANQVILLEFIQASLMEGKNILIASMLDDGIVAAWGNFPTKRLGGLYPHELLNSSIFSNRNAWRESREMKEDLYSLLEKDGSVKGYYHELVLPNGQKNAYSHDFYYMENYHDIPVRVVVSSPEDYEVIREGGIVVQ